MLHRPADPPPQKLCNALTRRGIYLTITDQPGVALARVMLAARAIRPGDVLILLLIDPEGMDQSAELYRVVGEFVPEARCWAYENDRATPLWEAGPEDAERWRLAETTRAVLRGDDDRDAPPLKLVRPEDSPYPPSSGQSIEPKPPQGSAPRPENPRPGPQTDDAHPHGRAVVSPDTAPYPADLGNIGITGITGISGPMDPDRGMGEVDRGADLLESSRSRVESSRSRAGHDSRP